MKRRRWKQIKALLERLQELAPGEQESFIVQACGDDQLLRDEITSLLKAHRETGPVDELAGALSGSLLVPFSPGRQISSGQEIGSYKVLGLIGRGGMGEVYKAEDTRLGRTVALKLLVPEAARGREAKQRLLREARATSALNHPNIVTIYSIEKTRDFDYIVMEYVDGDTLASRIERRSLELAEVLEVGIQVAEALQAAHTIGVIHRDVKPSNVLISSGGQIKLVDFGVAKRVSRVGGESTTRNDSFLLTADGTILGTVAYMSPEQTRGEALDQRTDLFSLGTFLYQAATGELPFQGPSALSIMHEIAVTDPPPPNVVDPALPPEFSAIVQRALAKNKEERFLSAAEMAEDMKRLRDGPGQRSSSATWSRHEPRARPGRGQKMERGAPTAASEDVPGPEPLSYTPAHLAGKILTSRPFVEGERKRITVLFCDLTDPVSSTSPPDPETRHRLLNRLFELAVEEVYRYEGVIHQFGENGFVALFGAPIAHEHHAWRAVLAAVSLRERLRSQELTSGERKASPRMGLNTGEVIVGAIGDNLRMNYTPVGNTTEVADSLQARARAGQILISNSTFGLVEGYCTMRFLDEAQTEGKGEPIRAWEVLSARRMGTRLEVAARRGLTPFVGRKRELQLLTESFDKAREGHGQIVFLVGDAGIGKSRLVKEFHRSTDKQATWIEGHAMSFGQSMAFHPLIDLLKCNFQIEEDDSEDMILEKTANGVLELDPHLEPILPFLRYLLSVNPGDPAVREMDPKLRRAEVFDALRKLLLRAAEVKPQIVLFEDLHWMDRATEEFLVLTADSIPSSRMLWLFTYRPDYVHPFGDRTYHARITLGTLSSENTLQMAKAMLAAKDLPGKLGALIVQKAEGNPFFVEEVVRSLRETRAIAPRGDKLILTRPLDQIGVPDSIQEVLMSRIDHLEEGPKKTLQLASVIGREFTHRLLDQLADFGEGTERYLQELKATELILEKRLFPEVTYIFRHALTQEVAHNSLLEQHRRQLHCRIGEAMEALLAGRLTDHYEVLAHHFEQGEAWVKALEYLCKSAEKAAQAFAPREAMALYGQALAVARRLGDAVDGMTVMDIHQARSALAFVMSDFEASRAESERLLALAHEAGDGIREANAQALYCLGVNLASRSGSRHCFRPQGY